MHAGTTVTMLMHDGMSAVAQATEIWP